jgi:hypothetical protein
MQNGHIKWLRAKRCHHGRASEDAGQGSLTTSSGSSVAGATLAFGMPLAPRLSVVLHWLSPTSRERGVPQPRLFVAQTTVVFVFFPQVGLRVALRRREAVADRPAVPWPGHRFAGPYLFSSWSALAKRQVLGPLVPEHQHYVSQVMSMVIPIQ